MALEVTTEVHSWGHASRAKTLELLNRRYQFSEAKPKALVKSVCKNCQICQVAKPRTGTQPSQRTFHPIPHSIFSSIAVDFVSLPPVTKKTKAGTVKYDGALVVVDRTSGYIVARPMCKAGFDGETAAKDFYEECFSFFGLPSEILSDNDVRLASSFFQTLCALSGVEQKTATAYHPERAHSV